jgi:hypothetical protein
MPFEEQLVGYWARVSKGFFFKGLLPERVRTSHDELWGHDRLLMDDAVIKTVGLWSSADRRDGFQEEAERNAYYKTWSQL